MKILPYSDSARDEAVVILHAGGVIAHATETCYGLACDLSNPDAVALLFAIKQRPETQPVSALFASVDDATKYVEWNERADELAKQYLPGPLTLILPMRRGVDLRLYPIPNIGDVRTYDSYVPTIGIRISPHPAAQSLVSAFGSPLSTTSANLHGHPNPYSTQDIAAQFADQPMQPDLILDYGILPQNPPSTVMDVSGTTEIVHRQGAIGK